MWELREKQRLHLCDCRLPCRISGSGLSPTPYQAPFHAAYALEKFLNLYLAPVSLCEPIPEPESGGLAPACHNDEVVWHLVPRSTLRAGSNTGGTGKANRLV